MLEHRDGQRLWEASTPSARHHAAPRSEAAATAPVRQGEDPHSVRVFASSLLESGKPCQALVALKPVRDHPEGQDLYRAARERCLQ